MTTNARRWLIGIAAALLLIVALVGAGVGWLARSDGGSAWLLSRVPGLQAGGSRGSLSGGPYSAERLVLTLGARTITIEGLAWDDARWIWRPHAERPGQPGTWIALALTAPRAARVVVSEAPPSGQAARAPTSLRLPVALSLPKARIGRVEIAGQAPITDLSFSAELGADEGALHRIDGLSLDWDKLHAEGSGRIGADAPFAVEFKARAQSREGQAPAWQAGAEASGPLAALAVQANLSSQKTASAALRLDATLQPFVPWPIAALSAGLQDLDLASLSSALPQTRLSGRAEIDSRGLDAPVAARIALKNAEPGRWDRQRLPVSVLDAELAGHPRDRSSLSVRRLSLQLSDERAAAGRIDGSGEWRGTEADLALTLQGVRPAALDARAPAMLLGGRAGFKLTGLPALDGSQPASTQQGLRAELALDGRFDARDALPITLRADAQADRDGTAWRFELRGARLQGGGARAEAGLVAARDGTGVWTLRSQGEGSGIDPALWFPGATASTAWRRGPHRLSGRWQAELRAEPAATAAAPNADPLARLLGWRGEAGLELRDSLLAGVPLQGALRLGGRGSPGWSVEADLRSGENRAALRGRLAPRAADDRWTVDLDLPALASLQALLALQPALASALRGPAGPAANAAPLLAGQVAGQVQLSGRWPELGAQAALRGSGLQTGRARAARIELKAQGGPRLESGVQIQLDGEQIIFDAQRIDTLQARLDGSLAEHRLSVDLSSPLRPPPWAQTLAGGGGNGSRVQLRGSGRWQPADTRQGLLPGRWQGEALQIEASARRPARVAVAGATAASSPGAAALPSALPSAPWLAARDLRLQVQLDAAGRVVAASAEPGRLQIGHAALRWSEANWRGRAGAAAASGSFDAQLEPLAVAPLLTLLQQPGRRIGGDLMLAGRARVALGTTMAADIVLERASGDLTLTDDTGTQAFGLTDLRLALEAQQGTWHFTQAVAGSNVGVLAGAVSLRLPPQATWPAPQTPIQGVLEWQVADLAAWAPFTPPGWRLGGMLRTSASIGGSFGAPEVTGQVSGSRLAIRNLLEGVDVRDGELLVSLRGEQANVERFVFKGGDGTLRLTGGATLGANPSARLQATAERFRVLGRFDRRIVASGNATLALNAEGLALDGRLRIDEGLIDFSRGNAPSLDSDVQVRGGRAAAALAADAQARAVPLLEPAPGANATGTSGTNGNGDSAAARPRSVRMAVLVDLGDALKLRGRGLDTRLRGNLALSSAGGRLAVNGSVRTEAGTYAAYGQNLEIERGQLFFAGAPENPRLDILAVRPNLDIRIGVAVTGFAQNPRVRLFSEPEMSDTDKLSWLVLGRAPEGLGRSDTALLQRAALALLAGEGEGLNNNLLSSIGLDEFSVRQSENGDVRDTVVSLGKQLSRRWYVGYERGVNSTTGTWQLIYRVAQRFTVRAQAGEDNALDAIWTWRWN